MQMELYKENLRKIQGEKWYFKFNPTEIVENKDGTRYVYVLDNE